MEIMLPVERKLVDWVRRHSLALCIACATILALGIRASLLSFLSADMDHFLLPWYEIIKGNGGLRGLREQVGNYNVIYQLIIALMTYLPWDPKILIKLLSIVFDFALALSIGKLAFDVSGRKFDRFVYAYSVTLLLPTVFLNSAAWGQCDSIYTAFCVLCVDLLLPPSSGRSNPPSRVVLAFVMFGFAFAMKFQTIFILPFMMYLYVLQGNFSLLHFLIPLGMNVAFPLMVGRGPLTTFWIYMMQSKQGLSRLSRNAVSIWLFLTQKARTMFIAAVLVTVAVFGIVLVLILRHPKRFRTMRGLMLLLVWSSWTAVMFLPGMHDRYNYIIEVLFIVLALMDLRMIPFAFSVELAGMATYGRYLSGNDTGYFLYPEALPLAMLGCVIAYLAFTGTIYRDAKRHEL